MRYVGSCVSLEEAVTLSFDHGIALGLTYWKEARKGLKPDSKWGLISLSHSLAVQFESLTTLPNLSAPVGPMPSTAY